MDHLQLSRQLHALCGEHDLVEVSGGYTPILRRRVVLHEPTNVFGTLCSSFFVKAAVSDTTQAWLDAEIERTLLVQGQAWAPRILGVIDDSIICYEDLGSACWPPLLGQADLDQLADVLPAIWAHQADVPDVVLPSIWYDRSYASSELISAGVHEQLCALAGDFDESGDDLVHFDLRLDNLCIVPERGPVLVDWNWAARGNKVLDLVTLTVNVHLLQSGLDLTRLVECAGSRASLRAGIAAYALYTNQLTAGCTSYDDYRSRVATAEHFPSELFELWLGSTRSALSLVEQLR